jgi:hypothetical protein
MGRAFFGVASFFLINTLAALLNSSKKSMKMRLYWEEKKNVVKNKIRDALNSYIYV